MSFKSNASTLTLAFLLGLPASLAFAQSDSPLNTLPPIVVSPTALPTPSDQVGSSVTVITAEQLERDQIRTVPDALKNVPGLNIVQTGGPGGQSSIFMRGTNSNHTKVLIDGIDISDPSNPGRLVDIGNLTTDDIERIEVLRGPQSGLYGSDSIGGVISITTKKGSGPAQWKTSIEGGSFSTFNQSAQVSGGTENTNYAFTVSHQRSDSIPVTPLSALPPGQKRNNDFYDNWTYSGRVGADLSDIFGVSLVSRYVDTGLRYTENDIAPPNPDQSSSRGHAFYGLADAVWKLWDGRFNNHVGFAYTDILRHSTDPDGFPGGMRGDFSGERTKVYWKSDLALMKGQTFLMGVEQEQEKGRIDFFGLTQGSNKNTGAYAELHSAFGDRFFLTSNIRHDDNENFGGHNTFRLAPSFVIRETGTTLKASYGTGFHAPSIDQLFGFGANPNLLPEESKGYDFGFEQNLFEKRIQFGATYFHNDIKNLIVCVGGFPCINENVGLAKTHGIEAFVAAQITSQLQVRTDYTHTEAIDASTGIDLKRRPSDKTSVSAVWQPTNKWTFSATALWVSGWLDTDRFAFTTVGAPGYHTINLAANYAMNDKVTIFGRIDNLLDERYQNPLGFEKTGFGVYAGLRVKQ